MEYSKKCPDKQTYWNVTNSRCQPCPFKAGYGITPNCGFGDDGHRHDVKHKPCEVNTFNDGSRADCQPCASCKPFGVLHPCSNTTNTKCRDPTVPTPELLAMDPGTAPPTSAAIAGAAILATMILVVICAGLIYMKRKRVPGFRRSSYTNPGFTPPGNNELEHILSPDILSAPLQRVLDNLDVLEELVILLDPEIQGVKSTKHLASLCSFPATWITYAYSMKDSKSPLRAVLEGVTSRHPDWTVGHLAGKLKQMKRNDAIAVLDKLQEFDP